jgi:hypothetical protein
MEARSDQPKLTGPADRLTAVIHRELAADALDVRLNSVCGDVQLAGDLGGSQQGR